MKTLNDLWKESGEDYSKKFRFIDWNFKTRYFKIIDVSEDGSIFNGILDCGTKMSYPKASDFWMEYSEGDEYAARSV